MSRLVLTTSTPGTPSPGTLEFDGRVPLFTPQGTQRGVIPGMQYFRLESPVAGANATGAQNALGVGVTLSSSTQYAFEAVYALSKSAGVTSHNVQLLFGGTASIGNIAYSFLRPSSSSSFTDVSQFNTVGGWIQTAAATNIATNYTSATSVLTVMLRGTVSITTGGTFVPQYQLSVAPGGAWTTAAGSYFLIYPIGVGGSNTIVGAWA